MKKLSFVFPGQGSQKPSMGQDIYESNGEVKKIFQKAEEILNRPLLSLIYGENREELNQTINTQPAVFLIDYLYFKYLEKNDLKPFAVAGHSLGEFAALVASEVIDWEEGIYLVGKRATFMEEAARKNPGGMLAIIGLDKNLLTEASQEIDGLEIANYNSPGQIVLSGTESAIKKAEDVFKRNGAKRVIKLQVSGGFHSTLMKKAEERFRNELKSIEFNKPTIPLVQNFTGKQESDPDLIKENLAKQISSPVKWIDCCQTLADELGAETWIEVGPGNVLTNLIKQILNNVEIYSANSLKSSQNIISLLRKL